MAITRHPEKSKSWFQRKTGLDGKNLRIKQAMSLRTHRKLFLDESGYIQNRGLAYFRKDFGISLPEYIKKNFPGQERIFFLDSGAGYYRMAGPLKRIFGNRICVTLLNLKHPVVTDEEIRNIEEQIEKLKKSKVKHSDLEKLMKLVINLKIARKNARMADNRRVGPIETFETNQKFHIILDYFGPLLYGRHYQRVIEKYFELLEPNGRILVHGTVINNNFIDENFGRNSTIARKTGHYLKGEYKHASYEIIKLPVTV